MKQPTKHFLLAIIQFFSTLFQRYFKNQSIPPTTIKGGTNAHHLKFIKEKGLKHTSRLERYAGHKKYHKVPAIQ